VRQLLSTSSRQQLPFTWHRVCGLEVQVRALQLVVELLCIRIALQRCSDPVQSVLMTRLPWLDLLLCSLQSNCI
jgi:hypothetical protein